MEMLLVSGSSRTSICVSERPGSPGTLLLSEPMSRMFIGLSGSAGTISLSASSISVISAAVLAADPVLPPPTSETSPFAYPTASPGVASTSTTTATPTSLTARWRPNAR